MATPIAGPSFEPLTSGPAEGEDPGWATGPVAFAQAGDDPSSGSIDDDPAAAGSAPPPPRRNLPRWFRTAALAGLVLVATAGALVWRGHHRAQILAQGLAQARARVLLDTFGGYRGAADLLQPLTRLDPVEAGSLRAFALAMLAADYRDEASAEEATRLLVEPERADSVPAFAHLAEAALALHAKEAGTATTQLGQAGPGPIADALRARVALLAGASGALREALDAAAASPSPYPAALALQGDQLRRQREWEGARAAYAAALDRSPNHPRATFGLAKLALGGHAAPGEAMAALQRLVDDRTGTGANERGRAALHLSALQARAGDRTAAFRTLDAAGLDPAARTWAEKAAGQEELERTAYRVVDGAPRSLLSASDDDAYEPPPPPPPPAPKAEPRNGAKSAPARHRVAKSKVHGGKTLPAKRTKAHPAKPVKKKAKVAKAPAKKKRPARLASAE
ncbi:MAG TPA: hypothetical protein VFE30_00310 [Anaeromyxobacteraceae bacterium]|jgi:tetratricopeptide (TPR) repeat protein|nr:hypothetical protein [Anaeromyxobacteraceae bacterium]